MSKKLKHEGHRVGDIIRAYDFEPVEGRRDRFVEGIITHVRRNGSKDAPFAHYEINVTKDSAFPDNPRQSVYVPMEVLLLEFDCRVACIAKRINGVG